MSSENIKYNEKNDHGQIHDNTIKFNNISNQVDISHGGCCSLPFLNKDEFKTTTYHDIILSH